MNEMIAWFRACLDDDEKAAKKATPGPWVVDSYPSGDDAVFADGDLIAGYAANYPEAPIPMEPEDVAHIARHDPAAVLADVAAKRAILDAYLPDGEDPHPGLPCTNDLVNDPDGLRYSPWDSCDRHIAASRTRIHNGLVIRLLASAYRHRPGWRTEWE